MERKDIIGILVEIIDMLQRNEIASAYSTLTTLHDILMTEELKEKSKELDS